MRFTDRDVPGAGRQTDLEEWESFRLEAREAYASIRRHGLAIGCVVLACLVLAAAVIALRPATYLGTTQILLDPRGLNVVSNEIVPSPPSADVNDAIIETQTRFLTSDAVLRKVVQDLSLQDDAEFSVRPGLAARFLAPLGLAEVRPITDPIGVAATLLAKQTAFQREGKSFVVTLSVKAAGSGRAAQIATAIGRTFVADVERRRREIVARARDAMGATLKGQSERVVAAEDAVERYKRSISVVDSDGRSLNTARLLELNSQLLVARAATRTLGARLAQLDARRASGTAGSPETPGTDALESQVLNQIKINLAEVTRQQENLRATLGPRHPAAAESEAQVRSLKAALTRETARLLATARGDLAGAQARERALERDVARTEAETTRTNGALVPLRQLEREALAQRSVYEKSLGRERELLEQESVGTTNASVVSAAKPNPDAVGLKPILLLAAAVLLGGLLGSAGAILVDRRGGRLHSPARLTARTGLPVIGVLPLAKASVGARPAIVSLLSRGGGTATARVLYRVADALDEIAADHPTRLLVIAASDGAVSTIVASNLVLAQASRGRRALLVDGDARSGRLTWLIPRDPRAEVVSCTVEGYPPFSATAAGERVSADPIPEQDGYDCVVIDGGAARDEFRLRQLAAAATAIVLVAESGIVTAERIEEMCDALMSNADKLVGVLMVVPGADAAIPAATLARPLPRRTDALAGHRNRLA